MNDDGSRTALIPEANTGDQCVEITLNGQEVERGNPPPHWISVECTQGRSCDWLRQSMITGSNPQWPLRTIVKLSPRHGWHRLAIKLSHGFIRHHTGGKTNNDIINRIVRPKKIQIHRQCHIRFFILLRTNTTSTCGTNAKPKTLFGEPHASTPWSVGMRANELISSQWTGQ